MFLLFVGAVLCPVIIFAACSTGVHLLSAFLCDVVPVLALHASDRFLLGLGYPDPSLAYG